MEKNRNRADDNLRDCFCGNIHFCAAKSDMSTSAVRLWGSIAAFSLSELLLMGLIASLQTLILAAWLDYIDGFRLELAGLAAMLFALAVAFTKGAFWAGL